MWTKAHAEKKPSISARAARFNSSPIPFTVQGKLTLARIKIKKGNDIKG